LTRKLQQFWIYKISSERLRNSKYTLQLTLAQARLNQEIISISDSQLVRTVREITENPFSETLVLDVSKEKQKLARGKNASRRRQRLSQLNEQLDAMLFIPQLVSITFSDKRHADVLLKKDGFLLNGKKYIPFMASSGMIRRNTMLFADEELVPILTERFENGRNKEVEIVPAKYGVYFSLVSSSSQSVGFPNICVVSDKVIRTTRRVDFSEWQSDDDIKESIDPLTHETEKELDLNAFDGQGLVSPKRAKMWSGDLGLDYVPSAFLVRSSFLKGLCVVFDFHKFAREKDIDVLTDIYGNTIRVADVDVIISESQFKLWNSYSSTDEYVRKCRANNMGWGISRYTPKMEKDYGFSSYQFIQSLKADEKVLQELCKPTVEWLSSVSGMDLNSTLLYSMGDVTLEKDWFKHIEPPFQALLLENSLLHDPYFIRRFDKNIAKRKREACMGRLVFPANYQFMISDPYAQCCHVFNIEFETLLEEGFCYSHYWNKKADTKEIALIRSPIVHYSEVNVLTLNATTVCKEWYSHIESGIVFPPFGVSLDMAIMGGADVDGDTCFSTNYKPFISARVKGLPIFYNTVTAPKAKIADRNSVLAAQAKGFGTKVGFLTNVGSTIVSMLADFAIDSKEYNTLFNRYKFLRTSQGYEIDKQKGLIIPEFPKWWTKKAKIRDDDSSLTKERYEFNNRLLVTKRPYFFRYLYDHMNSRWLNEESFYENISRTLYALTWSELLKLRDKTKEQNDLVAERIRTSAFVDNSSLMNRVSHHLEQNLLSLKTYRSQDRENFDYRVLCSITEPRVSKIDVEKMQLLFREYKSLKKALRENRTSHEDKDYSTLDQIKKYINDKAYSSITSNAEHLGNLAVVVCYNRLGESSRVFAWDCFGREIVENIKRKRKDKFVRIPKRSKTGNIQYLFSMYGTFLAQTEFEV